MKISKSIQEKMSSELLNIQVDWMNSRREVGTDERTFWGKSPRNFVSLIQKTISDPEFLRVVSMAVWIRDSFKPDGLLDIKAKPICFLDLATNNIRAIEDANIKTVGELHLMACKNQLLRIRGVGSMQCLMDISDALRKVGLPVIKAVA